MLGSDFDSRFGDMTSVNVSGWSPTSELKEDEDFITSAKDMVAGDPPD